MQNLPSLFASSMSVSATPFGLVALSACSYGLLLRTVRRYNPPPSVGQIKAISAGHAVLTSLLAVYVLRQPQWKTSTNLSSLHSGDSSTAGGNLDDSFNPLIQGRSALGNAIMALETGYLLYDTCAIASMQARRQGPSPGVWALRSSPIMMGHHILLGSALLCLQAYIAQARERGIWVIVAFLLMNASTPLLHARWWMWTVDKDSLLLDLAFAAAFAVSRFGTIAWVLQRYGAYHGLGPFEAFKRLRVSCKMGSAALVGMNGLWWILLVKQIITRSLWEKKTTKTF